MSDQPLQFVGTIPEMYDRGLGPHLFVDYASDLAKRVAATAPAKVLEIAAGTGIVSRMLRDALPPSAQLVVTDLTTPMLEVARRKFKTGEAVEFQLADATALPFADAAFDAIVCQFGVMFFPDKDKSYREVHRTLRPGGRYLFSVWDSPEFNQFARIGNDTIGGFFKTDPPGFYSLPFGYHRIDPIKASLLAAGFERLTVRVLRLEPQIPKARLFAEGLVLGNPVIEEIRKRGTADPEAVVAAVTDELQRVFGPDPGRLSIQSILFTASKR